MKNDERRNENYRTVLKKIKILDWKDRKSRTRNDYERGEGPNDL